MRTHICCLMRELELYRAHTPHAACVERLDDPYIELEHAQLNQHVVLLGVVDRRGQYSNTKPTICSQCRSILSKLKPVFLQFLIVWSPLQLTQVRKTPDQAVFVLTTTTTTTDGQNDYLTPCYACARGVIKEG